MFNPDDFLNSTVTGVLATRRPPMPEIEEATLLIKDLNARMTGGDNPQPVLDVTMVVDEQVARDVTGMTEPTVRYGCWLDLTPEGDLDMSEGKNIQLGRLREAVGQNQDGVAWQPSQLLGQVLRGKITQRPDKNDPETIYNDVVAIKAA